MTTGTEILIRVRDLEVGNVFMYMGVYFRIFKIEDGKKYYKAVFHGDSGLKKYFGEKCQMKVKLIKGNE